MASLKPVYGAAATASTPLFCPIMRQTTSRFGTNNPMQDRQVRLPYQWSSSNAHTDPQVAEKSLWRSRKSSKFQVPQIQQLPNRYPRQYSSSPMENEWKATSSCLQ